MVRRLYDKTPGNRYLIKINYCITNSEKMILIAGLSNVLRTSISGLNSKCLGRYHMLGIVS